MDIKKKINNKLLLLSNKLDNLYIINNNNLLIYEKIYNLLSEVDDYIEDLQYDNDINNELINDKIIIRIDEYKKNREFAIKFYPLFHLLYNNYLCDTS